MAMRRNSHIKVIAMRKIQLFAEAIIIMDSPYCQKQLKSGIHMNLVSST
jgi:hypothetical protein